MFKKSVMLKLFLVCLFSATLNTNPIFAQNKAVCFENRLNGNLKTCEEFKGKHHSDVIYKCKDENNLLKDFNPDKKWVKLKKCPEAVEKAGTVLFKGDNSFQLPVLPKKEDRTDDKL